MNVSPAIPESLAQSRSWRSLDDVSTRHGQHELYTSAEACQQGTQLHFVSGGPWLGIRLGEGLDADGNPKWWTAEAIAMLQGFTLLDKESRNAFIIIRTTSSPSPGLWASSQYGYEFEILEAGDPIPWRGTLHGEGSADDRTEQAFQLHERLEHVRQQESRDPSDETTTPDVQETPTTNNQTQDANHPSSPTIVSGVDMPGFTQGNYQYGHWGFPGDKLPENEKNRFRVFWEFASGREQVESIPVLLQVGRSNKCNFKCVYCADHRVGNTIPRTELTGSTWEDLLRLVPKARLISFHGVSEFMIDPEFFQIVEYCAEHKVGLSLNTNGSVCTPKHLEALANYPDMLDVAFSVDAATAETFKRIRGWDFHRILKNIRRYMDAFKRRKAKTTVSFSYVIVKSNIHEIVPFVYLVKAFGADYARYFRLNDYGFDWDVETKTGDVFSYSQECPSVAPEKYNRAIDEAEKLAEILDVPIDLPGPYEIAPSLPVLQEGAAE